MTQTALSHERLEELIYKVDRAFAGDHPTFTRQDAESIRKAADFVQAFKDNPSELLEIQEVYQSMKVLLKFGKFGVYTVSAVVIFLLNWNRLTGGQP